MISPEFEEAMAKKINAVSISLPASHAQLCSRIPPKSQRSSSKRQRR
jgi:hypothetical protein